MALPSWSATLLVAGRDFAGGSRPRFVGLPVDNARHVCVGSIAEDAAARLGYGMIPQAHLDIFLVREAGGGPFGAPTAEQCTAAVGAEPIPNHLNITDPSDRRRILPDGSFFVLRVQEVVAPSLAPRGGLLELACQLRRSVRALPVMNRTSPPARLTFLLLPARTAAICYLAFCSSRSRCWRAPCRRSRRSCCDSDA